MQLDELMLKGQLEHSLKIYLNKSMARIIENQQQPLKVGLESSNGSNISRNAKTNINLLW